jgi:hypothetical protein
MKYSKETYEQTEFYCPDEELSNHKQKIVKTRKEHKCCQCQKHIEKQNYALYETGFLDYKPVSAYTCLECCDKWLEELKAGGSK